MICAVCKRTIEPRTIRYHTPLGNERKMVVYECEYDDCMYDVNEYELEILELKAEISDLGSEIQKLGRQIEDI